MHFGPLITILVAGFGFAFIFGAVAHQLGISPLVGFLLAGVVVGPFTPGFVADQELAGQLAEIGVILLMFGVGLHFSLKDLLSVRAIAVPGAVVQIGVATLLGVGVSSWLGWDLFSGLVFGLALSVASTVVLLRALQEHRLVQTETGKIAVGWLIVEDLAMVLALVILPAIAQGLGPGISGPDGTSPSSLLLSNGIWAILALTVLKVAAFVALTLVVGRTVIPRILHWAAHTGSRELFRLAVLGTALGVAFMAASLFGVSFALGNVSSVTRSPLWEVREKGPPMAALPDDVVVATLAFRGWRTKIVAIPTATTTTDAQATILKSLSPFIDRRHDPHRGQTIPRARDCPCSAPRIPPRSDRLSRRPASP